MGRLVQHYDEIVSRYLAGESATEIGKTFGTSYRCIWKVLKKRGVSLRPRARFFPTEEHELCVVEKYESGLSLTQVAKEHGCHFATVRHVLLKHGIQPRRRGAMSHQFSADERREIIEAYKGGQSQDSIGKRMGCSQTLVSRVLRREGISTNRCGSNSPLWKGGMFQGPGGRVFIFVPDDSPYVSMRNQSGYVAEHRLVIARSLGRPLSPTETVHHVNGDILDNRIENLELRQGRHGRGAAFQCADCGSKNIRPVNLKR